jgi:hypothetical protein
MRAGQSMHPSYEPARVAAQAVPLPVARVTPVASAVEDGSDWFRYIDRSQTRPSGFMSAMQASAGLDKNTAALLVKIKAAGYRTNLAGQVLFDGRWIDPHEWTRRMPGMLD